MDLRDHPSNIQLTKSLPLLYMIVLKRQGLLDLQHFQLEVEAQVRDAYTACLFWLCTSDYVFLICHYADVKGLVDEKLCSYCWIEIYPSKRKDLNV